MPQAAVPLIAGAVGIGTAVMGTSAQKKAAKKAAGAQQDAMEQQLQLGRESLALNKDIYSANHELLSPFVGNGLMASNSMNALLGLPPAPAMPSPFAQQSSGTAMPGSGGPGALTAPPGFTAVAPPPSGLGEMAQRIVAGQPALGIVPGGSI